MDMLEVLQLKKIICFLLSAMLILSAVPYGFAIGDYYDDDFAERYSSLFEDPEDIAPGRAYRVITDGRKVTLKLL